MRRIGFHVGLSFLGCILFCLFVCFSFWYLLVSCSDFLHKEKNYLGLQSPFKVSLHYLQIMCFPRLGLSEKFTCWEHSRKKDDVFEQIYEKCPFFGMNSTKSQPSASFYSRKQPVWCCFFLKASHPSFV